MIHHPDAYTAQDALKDVRDAEERVECSATKRFY